MVWHSKRRVTNHPGLPGTVSVFWHWKLLLHPKKLLSLEESGWWATLADPRKVLHVLTLFLPDCPQQLLPVSYIIAFSSIPIINKTSPHCHLELRISKIEPISYLSKLIPYNHFWIPKQDFESHSRFISHFHFPYPNGHQITFVYSRWPKLIMGLQFYCKKTWGV